MSTPTVQSTTGSDLADVDPATGETLARVPCATPQQVEDAVQKARSTLSAWAGLGLAGRAEVLERVARRFEDEALIERLAALITSEMGKPIANARLEAGRSATGLRNLMESASTALAPIETREDGTVTRITREPVGVVAAITPWNFPLSMAREIIVPALIAGNTVVFKPSEIVPLCGEAMYEVFAAELPDGVMQLVQGSDQTGKALVASERSTWSASSVPSRPVDTSWRPAAHP